MTIDTDGLTRQQLAKIVDAGGRNIDVKFPPLGFVAARGDGVTDDGPAIQAVIDYVMALPRWTRPEVFFPAGVYLIGRPLRVRTYEVTLRGVGIPGTVITGTGVGPLIAVYPGGMAGNCNGPDGVVLKDEYLNTTNYMVPPLVTGAGSAFTTFTRADSAPGWVVWYDHWFGLLDACGVVRLDGLSAFCAELTLQLYALEVEDAYGHHSGQQSYFIGSKCRRFNSDAESQCFTVSHYAGKLVARMTVGGVLHTLLGVTTMSLSTPHHVALDYDGTTIRLFLDGLLEDSEAATGTVTMALHESIGIGSVPPFFPEMGKSTYGAPAALDAIRLSSVSRYTAPFSKPTTKWTLDANTLIVLNFDEQFDNFTVARTNYGDAYLMMRDDVEPGFALHVKIADMVLDSFEHGSGYRCGIIMIAAIQHSLDGILVNANTWGVYLFHDNFLGRFRRSRCAIFSAYGPFAMALGASNGVYSMESPEFLGGAYSLVLLNSSVTITAPWIETGSGVTRAGILVDGHSGVAAGLTILGGAVNSESGGYYLEAGIIAEGCELHMFGGVVEVFKAGIPSVRLERIKGASFDGTVFVGPASQSEIIKIGKRPVGPVTLVGAHKMYPNDVPWTNKPEAVMLINCPLNSSARPWVKSPRVRPLVEGAVSVPPVAGAVVLDAARFNRFDILVADGDAFTIARPTNGVAGQEITVTVLNQSGGAMGLITWSGVYAMSAWVNPADGYSRSIKFQYDGLGYVEVARTPADVPMPSTVPTDITNCVLWLRPESLSALSDTDPVATWPDESGEGNDFAQATAGRRPLYRTNRIGGQPTVVFDGIDDYLTAPDSASLNIVTAHSVFFVFKLTSLLPPDSFNSFCLFQKGNANDLRYRWAISASRFLSENVNDGSAILGVAAPVVLSAGTPYLDFEISGVAEHLQWIDGVYDSAQSNVDSDYGRWGVPASGTGHAAFLGGHTQFYCTYADMEIAEVALYDRELLEDERLQLEQYFARKYELAIGEAYE